MSRKVKFEKPEHMAKLMDKAMQSFYSVVPIEFTRIRWITPMCKSTPKTMAKALMRITFDVSKAFAKYHTAKAQFKPSDIDLNDTCQIRIGVDEYGKVFAEDSTMKHRTYNLHDIPGRVEAFC